jgi:hypothetical protein
VASKFKQEKINESLANVGKSLFEMLSKNDDVPVEVREKVKDLLDQHPIAKKKFEELTAAAAKS